MKKIVFESNLPLYYEVLIFIKVY